MKSTLYQRTHILSRALIPFTLLFILIATVVGSAFPRTIVDDLGNEIHLAAPPQRIFSTGLAMDNLLLAVVDPNRVVGVTRFAAHDSYVVDKIRPHMIQIDALNPEYIVAANPDLVLVASWNDPDAVAQIRRLGYKVYTFASFDYVTDALDNLRRIGNLTGEEARAETLIQDFYAQYGKIATQFVGQPSPRVLYWNAWESTAGSGTANDDIIRYAGGTNVVSAAGISGWPQIDLEFVLQAQPDVIITDSGQAFIDQLRKDPVVAALPAVRNGRIYQIDHMGALDHHFILAIDELARLLHPTAFEDSAQ